MKFFIAILMLATLASCEYQVKTREDLIKYRGECSDELKIPAAELEKYKKWDFPDDATAHCYMKCILEKFGLFSKDGFNVENIHQQMVGDSHADHSNEMHAKIEKCTKDAQGDDDCARAYSGFMCFIRENLDLVQRSVHAHDHDHTKH